MKILLLSAYDAVSHRHWHSTLVAHFPEHDWTVLTLPDRHYAWRMRGNSLSFAFQYRDQLTQPCDLLMATSMVDLSALRGFVPELASLPTILYFHENQFAYPDPGKDPNRLHGQLTSVYSAMCADQLVFNSDYNRRSFFAGLNNLVAKLPDEIDPAWFAALPDHSQLIPVPVESVLPNATRTIGGQQPVRILWNHRWEYDKQPEVFFQALRRLVEQNFEFDLNVIGQQFRQSPTVFEQAREWLGDRVNCWGYQDRDQYWQTLRQSDLVVSTSAHEFQGLSMLEAMACGCVPIAPDRLVYPEYIPDGLRYAVVAGQSAEQEAASLANKIVDLCTEQDGLERWRQRLNIDAYSAPCLIPQYRDLFERLAGLSK